MGIYSKYKPVIFWFRFDKYRWTSYPAMPDILRPPWTVTSWPQGKHNLLRFSIR